MIQDIKKTKFSRKIKSKISKLFQKIQEILKISSFLVISEIQDDARGVSQGAQAQEL